MPELTRHGFLFAAVAIPAVAMVGTTGCGRPLKEEECRTLIERYAELLVKDEEPTASPERVARVQTDARTLAEQNPMFELSACSKKVSRKSYDCAMHADTVNAIEQCLVF